MFNINDQALIADYITEALGILHDLHFMEGLFPIPTPVVLGHESSAVVVAVGEGITYVEPGKIFEVISVSTGNSVQFQNRVPRMLARNFVPGGTIDISYKDQELETGYAKALGVPLLMANLSQQVYQMGRAAGLNKEDGSAIIKVFERMVGVTIGRDD